MSILEIELKNKKEQQKTCENIYNAIQQCVTQAEKNTNDQLISKHVDTKNLNFTFDLSMCTEFGKIKDTLAKHSIK